MVSCAVSFPQLHSPNGFPTLPVSNGHDVIHPVRIVHPGFHEHDGLPAHPVDAEHREFHQHDGLPPHPIGSHAHQQFIRTI